MKHWTFICGLTYLIIGHQFLFSEIMTYNSTHLCRTVAPERLSKIRTSTDTISYWKVYNGGQLIKEGTLLDKTRILLTKGKILAKDTLVIEYFDDTPCQDCKPTMTIKTNEEKEIRKIQCDCSDGYSFSIRTTDLQVMAANNFTQALKFFFQDSNGFKKIYLFEIEIR